jgi:hypothetical protein
MEAKELNDIKRKKSRSYVVDKKKPQKRQVEVVSIQK